MSKFKKMKLVPLEDTSKEDLLGDILNTIKLSTSPDLKKASSLDKDIKIILNSNINDIQKVKLYKIKKTEEKEITIKNTNSTRKSELI